jgi:molybdate transport system substrate-binding protein
MERAPGCRAPIVALTMIGFVAAAVANVCAQDIKVLYALPLQPGLTKLAEEFRQQSGHTVTFEIPSGAELTRLLASDAPADVLINTPPTIDRAVSDGQAVGPKTSIGRVGISAVVRRGTPLPAIVTVDDLKRALIAADSVVYNTAGSGQYVQKILDDMGVTDQIKSRTARTANGPQTMEHVMRSTGNEIAFGLTPEAYPYADKGVQTVGPLPPSLQTYTVFEAIVLRRTKSQAAAAQFLTFITTPTARRVLNETGVE